MTVFSKLSTNKNEIATMPHKILPPIPFEHPEKKELHKGDFHMYKLHNNPMQEQSLVYKLLVPCFCSGTCKEFLAFEQNLTRVLTGQGATNGPSKFIVVT